MTVSEISKSKQREESESDQHVVKDGDNRRGSVDPLEPKGNINQHACQSIESCEDRLAAQLGANLGAHDLDVADGEDAESEEPSLRAETRRGVDAARRRKFVEIRDDSAMVLVARSDEALRQLRVTVARGWCRERTDRSA